jgi:hypothetical protein
MTDTALAILRSEFTRWRLSIQDDDRYREWTPSETQRVTVADLTDISPSNLFVMGFANWDGNIMLLPLWALELMAQGEALTAIDGTTAVVGQDRIDTDTRAGCIAYGFVHPKLKELENAAD